ncbi:MAG: glycosyltransferase [Chloroflexi bacterium]|nr:glycosyltransferase [Chloroflexota bacterium]
MIDLAVRALRLLRSNPRLFARRLAMVARDPYRGVRALSITRRRREAVQRSYDLWVRESADLPQPQPSEDGPLLSVILPVFETEGPLLEAAIRSVADQTYSNWELCIADDASRGPQVRETLERHARRDCRIRVAYRTERGHISAASNTALSLAGGEFVLLLDHDDVLAPEALACVAAAAQQDAEVDFVYSDEDKMDAGGRRVEPFFKPAWSPTLLTSCNYVTHLAAIRRSLALEVGGFRDDMVGSQDHDLFLRVAERARRVAHIPRILYHWRMAAGSTAGGSVAKPYAVEAARRAVRETVERRGLAARVEETHLNGIFAVRRQIRPRAAVSLIVGGRGKEWRSLLEMKGVDVCDVAFLCGRQDLPRGLVVVPDVGALRGDYLLWIDAASRPAGAQSVTSMLEHLEDRQVAVAGGTTRLPDGTVLQAGIAIGDGGQPEYAYAGLPALPQPNFYLNLKDLPREVSAVSVACCAMRRETWERLGGWDPVLPPPLAMCDLCLRARQGRYSAIYMPPARFIRRRLLPPLPSVLEQRWAWRDFQDPFWNPNMNPGSPDGLPFRVDTFPRSRTLLIPAPERSPPRPTSSP